MYNNIITSIKYKILKHKKNYESNSSWRVNYISYKERYIKLDFIYSESYLGHINWLIKIIGLLYQSAEINLETIINIFKLLIISIIMIFKL